MDIAKAFTYMLEDENWVTKLGIGAVLTFFRWLLLPIPLLVGYSVAVLRNVRDGYERPLPEWDDWGKLFMDGLFIMIAQFVYTLPLLLLLCVITVGMVASAGMAELSEEMAVASFLATFGLSACFFLLWYVAFIFISPAIMIQYGRTGQLGSCFRFGEVIAIVRRNMADILIIFMIVLVITFVFLGLTSVLSAIFCIGQVISLLITVAFSPYIMMVSGHLYGQIAAKESGIGPEKWEKGSDIY
jgi:hypothetical protein